MSNKSRSTLYTGVTSNLLGRVNYHKNLMGSTFTKRYKCVDLVYYEFYDHIATAIDREKQLKNWKRAWKDQIILELNPELKDLSDSIEDMI